MNRVGGKSNTGEGGEDPARAPRPEGQGRRYEFCKEEQDEETQGHSPVEAILNRSHPGAVDPGREKPEEAHAQSTDRRLEGLSKSPSAKYILAQI